MDQNLHPVLSSKTYATVILPLALQKEYTYFIPEFFLSEATFGKRVEVVFGKNRRYTALIIDVHEHAPQGYHPKPILGVIDPTPIITTDQIRFWRWMSEYYCCTLGEVMNAALPANLKLASETKVVLSPMFDGFYDHLSDNEYLVAEALNIQNTLSIGEIQGILDQKTVYPIIRSMLDKKLIYLVEDLVEKYKPKKVWLARLAEPFASQRELLNDAFELVARSKRQTEALMALIQLAKKQSPVRASDIYQKAGVDGSVLKAMAKKGIVDWFETEVSRIAGYEDEVIEAQELSAEQEQALSEIHTQFEDKEVVLLHGVTGSGKTRVYVELIKAALKKGEQVLYLVPEIALTTQLIRRLQKVFGDQIAVYHSRLNNNERVELWQAAGKGKPIVLGPRSAIFLPYQKLKLIIVDEEHDQSFKQQEPAPRYQGRDCAVFMAHMVGAKIVLGTATPSVETFSNAKGGKYGYVQLNQRFGGLEMPAWQVIDAKLALKKQELKNHFTQDLLNEIKATLDRNEQVILFQNRRGFAPSYQCADCGWHAECIHCDVTLTYHKFHDKLKCHYCGYSTAMPKACPACGSKQLTIKGFGTEKIEDELKIFFPDKHIGRMDWDTVRRKEAHSKIIQAFEEKKMDILVGTQMVTKGLDFDNVGLVGILSADQLLQFPDFRSSERAFQLMTQVGGRAGRKFKQGKVMIQAFHTAHPVIQEVINNDYNAFVQREKEERKAYRYPPYVRLIRVTLKHKKAPVVNEAAKLYHQMIRQPLGERLKGPAVPMVGRVRSYFLLDFLIKLERDTAVLNRTKQLLIDASTDLRQKKGLSGVRVVIDVDPY